MNEVYKPLRLHGMLLKFVIDDAFLSARISGQCVCEVKTLVLLLTALGFFLSWDKGPVCACATWKVSRPCD